MPCDQLLNNLLGMCAYQGRSQDFPCRETVRPRAEYCTTCEAAERLRHRDGALPILRDIVNEFEGAQWCEAAVQYLRAVDTRSECN